MHLKIHKFFIFSLEMSIERLSEEILEKILLSVPDYEIPSLTLVCKKFNNVISNSVKLMNSFEVQWQKNKQLDMRPLFKSARKYRKISVIDTSGIKANLQEFLSNHSRSLTSISFYECTMTSTELKNVLENVPKLIDFNCCEVNFEVDCDVSSVELKHLKNMELMYMYGDGFAGIVEFFSGVEIERFQYEDNFEMNEEETERFRDFLMSQRKLKRLSLTSNVSQKIISDEKFLKLHELSCEDIFLWMNGIDQRDDFQNYEQLQNFLESQRHSLKTLTLGRARIQHATLRLLMSIELKDIRFVSCVFPDTARTLDVTNKSIRKIFISMMEIVDVDTERILCDFLEKCHGAEKLRISCVDLTFELALVVAYNMKKLQKLKIFNSSLLPMTFPNLESLEILGCGKREILRLIRVNRHLKTLTVSNTFLYSHKFQSALNQTKIEKVIYIPS